MKIAREVLLSVVFVVILVGAGILLPPTLLDRVPRGTSRFWVHLRLSAGFWFPMLALLVIVTGITRLGFRVWFPRARSFVPCMLGCRLLLNVAAGPVEVPTNIAHAWTYGQCIDWVVFAVFATLPLLIPYRKRSANTASPAPSPATS